MKICSTEGCGRKHSCKGLCSKCYNAARYAQNREAVLARQKAYNEANRANVLAYQATYRAATVDAKRADNLTRYAANAEAHREYARAYRASLPAETKRERARARYAANPSYALEKTALWEKANPDKVKAKKHRRRGLERGAEGAWSAEDWQAILARYNHTCPCCGSVENLAADHIVPLSRGGNNWPWNIAPLCGSCNSRKHANWIAEYLPWDGVAAQAVLSVYLGPKRRKKAA